MTLEQIKDKTQQLKSQESSSLVANTDEVQVVGAVGSNPTLDTLQINPIKIKPLKLTGKAREHKYFKSYCEETNTDCDGEVYWDEGLEGYVCTKCELYTGVK